MTESLVDRIKKADEEIINSLSDIEISVLEVMLDYFRKNEPPSNKLIHKELLDMGYEVSRGEVKKLRISVVDQLKEIGVKRGL